MNREKARKGGARRGEEGSVEEQVGANFKQGGKGK